MSSFYLYYKESLDVIEAYTTLIELDGFNIFETNYFNTGNVVATAVKDKVWLPSQSILDVVQGLRKAPAPIAIRPDPKP